MRIGSAPRKVGSNNGGRARQADLLERLARRARERIELVAIAVVAGGVVEEGAEPGAADGRGRVGHRLQHVLELELTGEQRAGRVEDLERPRLFAERLLGRLEPRHVAAGAGHVERRAVGVAHHRRLHRQPAHGPARMDDAELHVEG